MSSKNEKRFRALERRIEAIEAVIDKMLYSLQEVGSLALTSAVRAAVLKLGLKPFKGREIPDAYMERILAELRPEIARFMRAGFDEREVLDAIALEIGRLLSDQATHR